MNTVKILIDFINEPGYFDLVGLFIFGFLSMICSIYYGSIVNKLSSRFDFTIAIIIYKWKYRINPIKRMGEIVFYLSIVMMIYSVLNFILKTVFWLLKIS